MAVPYTFGSATTSIPLSQLDSNFATTITLGNTAIQLGNTVTTLNNMTLANVTISSGTSSFSSIANGTSNVTVNSSGGNITLGTAGTTAVTIDTSQNVGIGTTSVPADAKVAIAGTGLVLQDASGAIQRFNKTLGTDTGWISNRSYGWHDGNGLALSTQTADALKFGTNSSERMRIDSSGNVMVATTSSAGKLNVAGQVTATGGIFKANGAPSLSAATAGEAILAPDSGSGAILYGRGTTYDATICQRSTSVALGVLTGTINVYAPGNIFINRNTTYSYANGSLCVEGTSGNPCLVVGTAGTTSYNNVVIGNGNGGVGTIATNGSVTTFNSISDYRLKENVQPITGALAKVAQLKPVTYKWKVDGADGEGFIAHELAEVFPHAVNGEKDATREEQYELTPAVKDEEGNITTPAVMSTRTVPAYQGIDTSFLVGTLTAAIQELKTIVDAQATEIESLKAKVGA